MTREEAIAVFRGFKFLPREMEAVDMAIKVLEQEPCEDAGEVSDGYHTFNQLYHQRAILFATIVNQNKDKAWKSFKHSDGKYCFDSNGEWFVVGVDTPEGSYTYHYSKEYWDYFECKELDCGKEWDGHTEEDVIRLLSLKQEPCEDAISLEAVIEWLKSKDIIKLSSQADTARKELKTLSSGKLQPSGDAISRQRVLDINFKRIILTTAKPAEMIEQEVKALPSVTPHPKAGKWILSGGYWRCSECKEKTLLKLDKAKGGYREYMPIKSNYCPNCGRKMIQEVKE